MFKIRFKIKIILNFKHYFGKLLSNGVETDQENFSKRKDKRVLFYKINYDSFYI
jgi:hypothetical protein